MKFRAQRAQIALLLTPGLAIFALFTVYPIIRLFWSSHLAAGFALRCFQRLSNPDSDTQRCAWRHNW